MPSDQASPCLQSQHTGVLKVGNASVAAAREPKKLPRLSNRLSKPLKKDDKMLKRRDPSALKIRTKKATKKTCDGSETRKPLHRSGTHLRSGTGGSKGCPTAFPYKLRRRRSLTLTKPNPLYCSPGMLPTTGAENEGGDNKGLGGDANSSGVDQPQRVSLSEKTQSLTTRDSPHPAVEAREGISERPPGLRGVQPKEQPNGSAGQEFLGNAVGCVGTRGRQAKRAQDPGVVGTAGASRMRKLSQGAAGVAMKDGKGSAPSMGARDVVLRTRQRRNVIPSAKDTKPPTHKSQPKSTASRSQRPERGPGAPSAQRTVQTRSMRKRRAADGDGVESVENKAKKPRLERSLACSAVSPKVVRDARNATRSLKGISFCTEGYEDNRVSHVVVGDNRRTLKALLGIANGAHFLDPSWLADSVAKGEWQDESRYKKAGKFAEAAERARAVLEDPRGKKPLEGKAIFVQAGAKRSSLVSLQRLAVALGARVVAARAADMIIVGKGLQKAGRVPSTATIVSEEWLVDVAENYAIPQAEEAQA